MVSEAPTNQNATHSSWSHEDNLSDDIKSSNKAHSCIEPGRNQELLKTESDVIESENDAANSDTPAVTLNDVWLQINNLTQQFKSRIARSEYEEQILKRYSDEIHEYRADLYKKMTLPFIKEIINIRNAANDMIERAKNQVNGAVSTDITSIKFLQDMLESALDNHEVTIRQPKRGEAIEKGLERPVGKVVTDNPKLHGTIAAIMNPTYLLGGKCIVPAKIKVYVYQETPANSAD